MSSYGLTLGMTNALNVKLRAAIGSWQRGESANAVNQLAALINQVNAQGGKRLTGAQTDELVDLAEAIITAINSGTAL